MKHFALILSALLLTACGGGGAPAPIAQVASTSLFQVKQAYTNDFNATTPYTFTVSGSVVSSGVVGTVTGNGSVSQSLVSSATFESAAAQRKTKTVNGSINVSVAGNTSTTALPTTSVTTFVSPAFDLLGFSSVDAYSRAAAATNIPTTARVGDSGTVGTIYTFGPVPVDIQATSVITWALSADTATTALLTLTQNTWNSVGTFVGTQTDVFRLTPSGGITRLSGTSLLTGLGSLTFTY